MAGERTEIRIAGRYLLGSSLGAGGMGRVWLAHDEVLRREVAIKEIALPFGLADDEREELRTRTLREARAAARLNHANVVKIYDVFTSEERPWIVMEYVCGRSLLEVVKEDGPLPADQVAGIGLALLSALDAAHRAGVVHRDVKPSNVLLADDGRVVLTDFGSALMDESEGAITRTGVIVGSPQYIAPERAFNGTSTPESDLWSLGATLYTAVEGRAPYARQTAMATLTALAAKRPDPVRLAGPLKPVLYGLLQRKPQARLTPAQAADRLWQVASSKSSGRSRWVAEPRSPVDLLRPNGDEPGAGVVIVPGGQRPAQIASPQPEEPHRLELRHPSQQPPVQPSQTSQPPEQQARPEPGEKRQPATADVPALSGPFPTPPFPEAPPGGRRRPRRWQWAVASVIAVVLLAAGSFAVWRNSDRPADGGPAAINAGVGGAANGAAASPPATASSPSATPATSAPPPKPFVLPAGFAWWSHPTGFRVAIPARWEMIREGRTEKVFCSPIDPSTLRARLWTPADPDPVAALVKAESRAKLAGYKRIRIQASPNAYAAEWEYTYTDRGRRLHGIERIFLVANRAYVIQWRTPQPIWQANLRRLSVITASFRPPARPSA